MTATNDDGPKISPWRPTASHHKCNFLITLHSLYAYLILYNCVMSVFIIKNLKLLNLNFADTRIGASVYIRISVRLIRMPTVDYWQTLTMHGGLWPTEIFGRIVSISSEEFILQLINSKCACYCIIVYVRFCRCYHLWWIKIYIITRDRRRQNTHRPK